MGHGDAAPRPFDGSGLYQAALETTPAAVLIADRAGAIVFVNREVERLFGYSRDELIGKSVELLVPEAVQVAHAAHREHYARDPELRQMVAGRALVGRRKDGSLIPVEIGLNSMQAGGELLLLASIIDVGERSRAQDSRRAAIEEQLAFEHVFAQLSVKFINLPDDEVLEAIHGGLGQVGEWLAADRCSFFRIDQDGILSDPVTWTAPDVEAVAASLDVRSRFPWSVEQLLAGKVVSFETVQDHPGATDRASFEEIGTQSAVYLPLSVEGQVAGALGCSTVRSPRRWRPDELRRLEVIAGVFSQVLARLRRDESLRAAAAEVRRLKDQLHAENVYLRREERERLGLTRVVGQSAAIQTVLEQIHQVAGTDSTVLLLGETGTGKELFATQIHELSARHGRAMVRVNCGAIPATLIESELFGRERGAFTGALARQAGRFELADHSTIFLDEIGDLPPDVQVKLLRVLEERTIERLGSPRPITVDTRIIAATHRNLEQRVREGTFREDLYYRLDVFPIHVPPLRERAEDIPLLVWRFVEEFSKAFGKRIDAIDKDNLTALQQHPWPGNIRELRNAVERAMIVSTSRRLTIPLPHVTTTVTTRRSAKLIDVEKDHIRSVLEATAWRIRGVGGAADRLGMKPTTLETRMAKLGLRRPRAS